MRFEFRYPRPYEMFPPDLMQFKLIVEVNERTWRQRGGEQMDEGHEMPVISKYACIEIYKGGKYWTLFGEQGSVVVRSLATG